MELANSLSETALDGSELREGEAQLLGQLKQLREVESQFEERADGLKVLKLRAAAEVAAAAAVVTPLREELSALNAAEAAAARSTAANNAAAGRDEVALLGAERINAGLRNAVTTLDEAIKAKEAELKASTADACDTAKREAAYCGEQRAAVPGTKHFPKIEMAELSITEAKSELAASVAAFDRYANTVFGPGGVVPPDMQAQAAALLNRGWSNDQMRDAVRHAAGPTGLPQGW